MDHFGSECSYDLFWIRVLVGLFGIMLCSSGKEGGCEWSVGCASPIHHESRPSPPNIHQHPDLPPVRELGKGERGVPRVRMGRKRERECSPWKKGENECAMSAPRNQDRMVPPSNATPSSSLLAEAGKSTSLSEHSFQMRRNT